MIKHKRNSLKLTQKELAEKIGVDQSYISDLELNKRIPSFFIFKKLCIELHLCPIQLINFFIKENNSIEFTCCEGSNNCTSY